MNEVLLVLVALPLVAPLQLKPFPVAPAGQVESKSAAVLAR
jgi:hypothetical protein